MKKLSLVFALSSVMLLTGCVSVPSLNFTPENIEFSTHKIDADAKSVSVSAAPEQERTGDVEIGFAGNQYEDTFRQTFKDSLEEAIAVSGIFNDLSQTKVSIFAKIKKFDTPSIGITFPTECEVSYQIQDRGTGRIIYSEVIKSVGECEASYAFTGYTRATEARNRSVRNNIRLFIESLQKSDLATVEVR